MNLDRTAFLLIAHGSRLQEANQEVFELASKLSEILGHSVHACFLELAAPSIPQVIDLVLASGVHRFKILPYFLTQGRHVQQDIPKLLQSKINQYPQLEIQMLDYLGAYPMLVELLGKIFRG